MSDPIDIPIEETEDNYAPAEGGTPAGAQTFNAAAARDQFLSPGGLKTGDLVGVTTQPDGTRDTSRAMYAITGNPPREERKRAREEALGMVKEYNAEKLRESLKIPDTVEPGSAEMIEYQLRNASILARSELRTKKDPNAPDAKRIQKNLDDYARQDDLLRQVYRSTKTEAQAQLKRLSPNDPQYNAVRGQEINPQKISATDAMDRLERLKAGLERQYKLADSSTRDSIIQKINSAESLQARLVNEAARVPVKKQEEHDRPAGFMPETGRPARAKTDTDKLIKARSELAEVVAQKLAAETRRHGFGQLYGHTHAIEDDVNVAFGNYPGKGFAKGYAVVDHKEYDSLFAMIRPGDPSRNVSDPDGGPQPLVWNAFPYRNTTTFREPREVKHGPFGLLNETVYVETETPKQFRSADGSTRQAGPDWTQFKLTMAIQSGSESRRGATTMLNVVVPPEIAAQMDVALRQNHNFPDLYFQALFPEAVTKNPSEVDPFGPKETYSLGHLRRAPTEKMWYINDCPGKSTRELLTLPDPIKY